MRGKKSRAVRARGDAPEGGKQWQSWPNQLVIGYPQPSSRSPKQRKEPLENASHVRNAVARFNQVKGVTEAERRAAWKRIQSAAKRYGVELQESE
jgi:hypothetical protein